MKTIIGKYNSADVYTDLIEESAEVQIKQLCDQPFTKDCRIAIMPDVHAGAGCVIGFTANLGDLVIPNLIGVDIGCGMLVVCLGKTEMDNRELDNIIHNHVPAGMNTHDVAAVSYPALRDLHCYNDLKNVSRIECSLGTLGGGNHFIEVDVDDGNQYLVIHTGSRNLGKQVAEHLYADEGISGTRADKRPQFQKMIEDCHKGKIDMIITKSVSRFARNTVDCLDYVRSLKEIGVGIYFEEQNIDTLKSDSELYLVIYAGFAQSESESISKNITWTHRKNFEDGKPIFMYSRMLGYRKGEDGNPEIVPEEAAIVQRVFDMYLSGKSTDEISEILQAEKIVIPGKKLTFSKSMIIRMLKNEKYCGDAILQKTVTIDPISKKRKANEGEAPMWLVENSHPAIVTREIFNKAQEESARRKAKAPVSQKSAMTASGKYSKYALTEVMICGECGSRYKRVTWNIRGKRRIVWRCISRLDYGKKYCTESITVDEQALQRAIVRALNRFNVEDEATYLLLMKSTIGEAVGINGSSDEIDLLERRIDALNKRMLDLVSLSVQEGDDAENHEDDFKNISTQIEQLTKRITAIRESESENGDFQARLKEIQDIIDKRRENKDIYDDSIVRQMVECIKVYHDGRLQIILGGGYELEEYLEK